MIVNTQSAATQTDLAELVGVTQQAISAMVGAGKLEISGTLGDALQAYCERLRDQAAGRLGSELGGLDLVQERAALAREQRIAQELKNQVLRGEYAPIGLLADVLGIASSAVVDRFDQLEGALRKSCPNISDEVLSTVLGVVTAARNEWIRATVRLVDEAVDRFAIEDEAGDLDQPPDDDEAQQASESLYQVAAGAVVLKGVNL